MTDATRSHIQDFAKSIRFSWVVTISPVPSLLFVRRSDFTRFLEVRRDRNACRLGRGAPPVAVLDVLVACRRVVVRWQVMGWGLGCVPGGGLRFAAPTLPRFVWGLIHRGWLSN